MGASRPLGQGCDRASCSCACSPSRRGSGVGAVCLIVADLVTLKARLARRVAAWGTRYPPFSTARIKATVAGDVTRLLTDKAWLLAATFPPPLALAVAGGREARGPTGIIENTAIIEGATTPPVRLASGGGREKLVEHIEGLCILFEGLSIDIELSLIPVKDGLDVAFLAHPVHSVRFFHIQHCQPASFFN